MLELICEELGVEVGEKWLGNDGCEYRITKNGEILLYDKRGFYSGSRGFDRWASIFNGDLKPMWEPKDGEQYYTPDPLVKDLYDNPYWTNGKMDNIWLDRGLVFKTKEEALEATNKMLEALKGDQS